MESSAQILRIEKISPNDGHGLRTVVFFKGCPLRCQWCSTPESQKMAPEIYYQSVKCSGCQRCIDHCVHGALTLDAATGKVLWNPQKCRHCCTCTKDCPTGALDVYGKSMTLSEIMKIILRDEIFYFHSGGGITLSGGDVLCHSEFARDLLKQCRDAGIHTMAELDMYGDYAKIAALLPHLDAFYADIKLMDDAAHRRFTGVSNQSILSNIRQASRNAKPGSLHIRVPLIPGINDTQDNILATADFCSALESCAELEFLPYHRLGSTTYAFLGCSYPLEDRSALSFEDAQRILAPLKERSLPFPVKISGKPL
ncbi:MAG: glycyl-radical enzyme activating protein [Eubacterium sp.]|nr:glycyl-radical enzyme activating protein [Eubacterium sp.]